MNMLSQGNYADQTKEAYAANILTVQQRTIRENVEARIRFHEAEAIRFKGILQDLETKPLSEMRISDLRAAMDY